MGENDITAREAGRQIAERGFADDVRRGRTNRERTQDGGAADADDRRDDERKPTRRREEIDDNDEPDAGDDDTSDEQEDAADTSTREDGEDGDDDLDDGHEADDEGDREDDNRREKLFEVKVNGETLKVTQTELLAGYSRTKDYHQKTQKLAETGRKLNGQHAQVAQLVTKRLQSVNAVVNGVRTMLAGDLNSSEMQALRVRDPNAWVVAREDYNARIRQVDDVLNHLHTEYERHRGEVETTQKQTASATVEQEIERLREFIPDWSEGKNGKPSGAQRLGDYLRKSGFQDAEFTDIADHRMLAIADKARRYDELVARRSTEPERKAKPVPKRVVPGQSKTASNGQRSDRQDRSEFKQARERLAKTGNMRDAGDALNAMFRRDAKRGDKRRPR